MLAPPPPPRLPHSRARRLPVMRTNIRLYARDLATTNPHNSEVFVVWRRGSLETKRMLEVYYIQQDVFMNPGMVALQIPSAYLQDQLQDL